mmetsp:Transcript_15695/g.27286  ORF Transcript_15695/g.27286 Transcript_15695/m.27286 type:complete len:216 (-) Transcript_15695:747-1394(-)
MRLATNETDNFLPFFQGRIASRWIVCTGMQQNDGTILCPFNVLNHPFQIQGIFGSVVIPILANFQSAIFENFDMIAPSWVGNVNGMIGPELRQKASTQKTRPRSAQGLYSGNVFFNVHVLSVGKLHGAIDKVPIAFNGQIFFDFVVFQESVFSLADGRKDVWFPLFGSIRSDTDIDLVGIGTGFEIGGNSQNGIRSRLGNVLPNARDGVIVFSVV